MAAFPIQIDATATEHRVFTITAVTGPGPWVEARPIPTLSLDPGTYGFLVASGFPVLFSFEVTSNGTVQYDESSAGNFLNGIGSSTLRVLGLPVTLDARYLAGWTRVHGAPARNEDWFTRRDCRMVPGIHQFQHAAGIVGDFEVTLKPSGLFTYDQAYDIDSGGFLGGYGTSALELLGYPLLVDARRSGGTGVAVQPLWVVPPEIQFTERSVQFVNLLPTDRPLALQFNGGLSQAIFNVERDGRVAFHGALSPHLAVDAFHRLTRLTVLGPIA